MKITKKIIALALTVIICLSASYVVMAEEKESNNFYYLFRSENFELPQGGGWSVQTNADTYANSIPGNYLKDSAWQGPGATTKLYITEESDYMVWVMMCGFSGENETRFSNIAIDSTPDDKDFMARVTNAWAWIKGETVFHLTPGEHTLTLSTGMPSNCCAAVFVTNDLSFVLDSESTPYSDIEQYADQVAPTLDGDVELSKDGVSTVVATFPTASDNIAVAGVSYSLNGKEITPDENGMYRAEKLMPLSEYTFSMKAFDSMGNSVETSETIRLCDWKITSCTMTDLSSNEEIGSLGDISEGCKKIKLSFDVEKYLNGMAVTPIVVGIYTKEQSKMVSLVTGNVIAFGNTATPSVEIELSEEIIANPGEFIVKAVLIDDMDNISPMSDMFVFNTQEVAE